ncbi:MAG: hypothetical protein OXF66_03705 [Gammaproteobacteria bacterium]|nr:hypothetical protein [Gammaproteobacteria bacterium]MCY4165191.1 hypothetical protein [Gammaproteobacteria bacterium]MCY4254672.1 hypothetical protein [Gammaproteobacteria bacterium]MCY4340996.1 hypothetical protein [Gammaproteobacteria bacterium]
MTDAAVNLWGRRIGAANRVGSLKAAKVGFQPNRECREAGNRPRH